MSERKVFICDVSICNGCYCCQIACKDEHCGNDWMPYSMSQPETGHFWLKLKEYIRGTVPRVKMHYIPVFCMHCDNAPCIAVCPVAGAVYRRDDGLIIIDAARCNGCQKCIPACPCNAIYFNSELKIAQKCTGCAHLLDNGWKEPRCVEVCPTGALKFGSESEFKDLIRKAEDLKSEAEMQPRVYYLNIPKRFIAGTVYDPINKEVIKKAFCTLSDLNSRREYKVETDGFGDFWFEGLPESIFRLKIEADGFQTKEIKELCTERDINLGDIPLSIL